MLVVFFNNILLFCTLVAKEFLGSPISSWTQTVMLDRFAEGRDNHGSILDVVMKGKKHQFARYKNVCISSLLFRQISS